MESTNFLIMLAATVTAIGVITVGIRKATIVVKRFIHFLDDYFGEEARPGFQGRPGMQERMRIIEQELKCVSYEMRPNSGTSIKDAIGRIEKRLEQLEQRKD
jgi:hypothetical protein